jgi:GTP-binding protein HflX
MSTEVLFTDTVGFIQKLPTHLVAAFRATLEELEAADVLVHVVDVSNPRLWRKQKQAVDATLAELGLGDKPTVVLWNKADAAAYVTPQRLQQEAARREGTVAASAKTGEGLQGLVRLVERALAAALLEPIEALVPYAAAASGAGSEGIGGSGAGVRGGGVESPMELVQLAHATGAVTQLEYGPEGCRLAAQVPRALAGRLGPYRTDGGGTLAHGRAARPDEDAEEDWVAIAKKRKGYASAGAGAAA